MPLYTYRCSKCAKERVMLRLYKERRLPLACTCTGAMVLLPPKIMPPSVMETADKYRHVQQRKNQAKRLKKRSKDYFVEHELTEIIGKHGIKDAKKMGWITRKGKVVKKSDLS